MAPKKSNQIPIGEPAYRFGNFALVPDDRLLLRDGEPVPLPPKVFDLLLLLVENAGHLTRRDRIIDTLWAGAYVEDANLTNSIVLLRRVLGGDAIQTVPKHGYRFAVSLDGQPGVSEGVYRRFREACDLIWKRSPEALKQARTLFWSCLADDPGFAEAWAWLGRCCRFLHKYGVEADASALLAEKAFERALTLNPDLACAHQFYTLLQADHGRAKEAMARLLDRVKRHPDDAESFAGLVQVCRFCGLLDESLAAHQRAIALDPSLATSVRHTHFAACDFAAVVENDRSGAASYLDLGAWAALGFDSRVVALGRERLESGAMTPLMAGLVESLLACIAGEADAVAQTVASLSLDGDPETMLYFARHLARCGRTGDAMRMLERCVEGGFWCGHALEHDPWLRTCREAPGGRALVETARIHETEARATFRDAGGDQVLGATRYTSPLRPAPDGHSRTGRCAGS